jgi:hypothetical protein
MEKSVTRLAANFFAIALIIVGAALWRSALPAAGMGAMALGTLLLLDVAGRFERPAAIAARIARRRRRPAQVFDLASARRARITAARRRRSGAPVRASIPTRGHRITAGTSERDRRGR